MGRKETYEYDFKCINPTNYELKITLPASKKLFMKIFNKALSKLKRQKGINVKGDPESIGGFLIPSEYNKLIKVAINKLIINLSNKFKMDGGITIISSYVDKCYFKKCSDKWNIDINVSGLYVQK
jgi:hypothetical protein